jgi:hypothetical protein
VTASAIARQVSSWPARHWLVVAVAAVLAALVLGVPTDLVPTPLFRRMSPVAWWDYPIWAASAALAGLIAATYVAPGGVAAGREKTALGGGLLSYLAVGCPSCNKLAVLALGAGGASSYFAPVQPFLGLAGLGVLAATLAWRLRGLAVCRVEL